MESNEDAYGRFILTLSKLGISKARICHADDEEFHFMRMMEFSFCDKWGK